MGPANLCHLITSGRLLYRSYSGQFKHAHIKTNYKVKTLFFFVMYAR